MTNGSLLFDFLLSGIRARVKDAFGQMLDESDSLSDADLLLLGQLTGQATLPWVGMVHWGRLCLFLGNWKQKTPCVAQVCSASVASQIYHEGGGAFFTSSLLLLVRLSKWVQAVPCNEKLWLSVSVCDSLSEYEHSHTHIGWGEWWQSATASGLTCVRVRGE